MKQYKDIIAWEDKMESKAERIKQRTMKTIKRTWRPRTAVIAAFLMLTTLIPVLGGCSSPSSQEQQIPQVDQTPSTASLHEGEMDNLKALLANAGSLPPAELRAGLSTAKENLASLNSQMEEEFASTTEVLNRLDLPDKMQIHQETMAKFQDSKNRLNTAIDETIASSDSDIAARSASLSSLVNELNPEEESQPLGAELPNQLVERDPVAPVLGANIAPAYLAGAPDLIPSDLPVEPTPEDLAPTIDAQQSQEIIDKAAELENDPVKIYEWVRNNIDFEPYYGSKKGAAETLAELAGNDMDTASLLIALYRISGIPARYVTGVIEITAEQAMAWTATEVPEAALRLFASGGTPITGIQEGGAITRFQLTHTYSEAYINYSNYRGAAGGEGPKEWIPLDGSYKTYEIKEAIASEVELPCSPEEFLSEMQETGCVDIESGIINNLPEEEYQEFIQSYQASVCSFIDQQSDNYSLREILCDQVLIVGSSPGFMPSALPYSCLEINSEINDLPASIRYRIGIRIHRANDGVGLLAYDLDTPSLNNKGYGIYFQAASEDDVLIADSYDSFNEIPAYSVSMVPVLTDGDNNILCQAGQNTITMGQDCIATVRIEIPGMEATEQSDYLVAGTPASLIFCSGEMTKERLVSRQNELASLNEYLASSQGNANISVEPRNFLHLLLSSVGESYFIQSHSVDKWAGSCGDYNVFHDISYCRSFMGLSVEKLYGVAISVSLAGQALDVDRDARVCASRNNTESIPAFCRTTGILKSGLEAKVFRQLLDWIPEGSAEVDSVSTTSLHQYSLENNQPIQYLGEGYENAIDSISCSPGTKSELFNYLNQGMEIFIPGSQYDMPYWNGWAYTVVDPDTGSGAYIIQGGMAGAWVDYASCGLIVGEWFLTLMSMMHAEVTNKMVATPWMFGAIGMIALSYELGIAQIASSAPTEADALGGAMIYTAITFAILEVTVALGRTIAGTFYAYVIGLVASCILLSLPGLLYE